MENFPGQAPGATFVQLQYEFRSDETSQFNFRAEDITMRNAQRRALTVTILICHSYYYYHSQKKWYFGVTKNLSLLESKLFIKNV